MALSIRKLSAFVGAVLAGAAICGTFNAAVSGGDPVEAVYQWMRGIVFGGMCGAAAWWMISAVSAGKHGGDRSFSDGQP
jgi:hypothetical protein